MEAAVEQLLEWTAPQGVVLNGIYPMELAGRGIGIVSTRRLEANEVILKIPTSALRTLDTIPTSIVQRLRGASVHAILAAVLCLEDGKSSVNGNGNGNGDAGLARWRAVFPSRADVVTSMPICWPAKLRALLPAAARALLSKQQDKFNKDWALVSAAYPSRVGEAGEETGSIAKDDYLYAWLLVNTRTFYHRKTTGAKTKASLAQDHMALQPVADLFNHSPEGHCDVTADDHAFTFTTTRVHKPGEEVFIRYGPHGNDKLLIEYGFTLSPPPSLPKPTHTEEPAAAANPWDETSLDTYLCPSFSALQKEHLQAAGFWESYMLDSQTACYRTHVALRMICLPLWHWQDVLDGIRDEDEDKPAIDAELLKVLKQYEADICSTLREVEETTAGDDGMRASLRNRWLQIQELVEKSIEKLQD